MNTVPHPDECRIVSRGPSRTRLLNRRAVRELALKISREERAGKFKRVAASFYEELCGLLRVMITSRVRRHPSVGKTLMGPKA